VGAGDLWNEATGECGDDASLWRGRSRRGADADDVGYGHAMGRNQIVVFPNLQLSTATAFFADLQPKLATMNVPVWRDELYFEYHRGVLRTQAETKRRIRQTEELLLNAEKFSAIATSFGHKYPAEELDRGWKDLLFDDFHDIFPGSGIAVNYLDAKRNLEDVGRVGQQILDGSLEEIAENINLKGSGVPVVVFNSLSWARDEVVETEVRLPEPASSVEVIDAGGKPVASQVILTERGTRRIRLLLKASVPALGYSTYYVRANAKPAPTPAIVKATGDMLRMSLCG